MKNKEEKTVKRVLNIKRKLTSLENVRSKTKEIKQKYDEVVLCLYEGKEEVGGGNTQEDRVQQTDQRPPEIQQEDRHDAHEPQDPRVGQVLQGQEQRTFLLTLETLTSNIGPAIEHGLAEHRESQQGANGPHRIPRAQKDVLFGQVAPIQAAERGQVEGGNA